MENSSAIERLKRFTPLVWVMLVGNFFVRASYYMVWPFLAVILYENYGLSATEVGLLLTVSATFAVFLGFYTGNLADRFGRTKMLYTAVFVGVISFSLLAVAESLWLFATSVFLACLPRTLWDAPSKALLTEELADAKDRELALHLLYFLVNVGAALGPLYGLWAGLNGEQFSFIYTGISYIGLLLALLYFRPKLSEAQTFALQSAAQSVPKFAKWLRILRKDKVFLIVLIATTLVYLVYAQCDSSLVQYLTRAEVPDLAWLISSLIIANSSVIIVCQFPLLHLMRNWRIENRLYAGGVILIISQVMMALNDVHNIWGWIAAMMVLSLSEAIMFTNINVYIDRLAPDNLKASYFGAAGLCSLGYALAPILGGLILDFYSGMMLFIIMTLVSITALGFYRIAELRPKTTAEAI
ncbi:MDR family MFS transporter [Pseudoalteromonas sp. NC201]|uniref:MDR family MFS transporter n=1 Tax=Pseudoalteromonas sp. NC201 TaxID=1514074 RepID=UPI000C7D71A8|nr:MFS transporter [Pseudoalteromonas sp. NC201]AUJ69385.1 Multidrug resistance protein MdtH [Pseudoalteromonas sp. NC201]